MTKIILFGDNDTTADAVKVLDAIKHEATVDLWIFLGDGPYDKSGTKWVEMMKPFFPNITKLVIAQGNHDNEESESAQTQKDIESWLPALKESPAEKEGTDASWQSPTWLTSKQVKDVYVIGMNSQDMDIEFKRKQYNWTLKQLKIATDLRAQGKINWIINCVHKPWFTLKSSHSPYTAVREIYSEPFQKAGVDMNFHGHNHNDQAWFPMIAMQQEGNAAGKQLKVLAKDGKTLDMVPPHGWTTNICGHSGHEHNPIKEDPKANENVMWANDAEYSYVVLETDSVTKIANVKWKDVAGKVLFEYNMSRAAAPTKVTPPTPTPKPVTPTPTPTTAVPPIPPPGPGYRWDAIKKTWIPELEHPSFIPDHYTSTVPTPPAKPLPPQPTTPTPDNSGVLDQMGIKWLVAKGKQSMIEQTRDEADDDRWSGNVLGLKQGFEATMIAKSTGVASDGHFAMKHGGGNHSKGDWKNARWYDTGIRKDGTIQLQYEGPHPKNHDFSLPGGKQLIKNIGKDLDGNFIGLKWCLQTVKPDSSPATGGIRCRLWVDTDPIDPATKKPKNNWKLVYDFIDGVDVKVIEPQTYTMPDEMDMEVRRSGTKSHEIYGGGLHVRGL